MAKDKHTTLGRETTQIVGQVQRILEAGERLRAALLCERWMDGPGRHPDRRQRWLRARAATGRADAAYREAIERCYRMAKETASHRTRRNSGRETRPASPTLHTAILSSL